MAHRARWPLIAVALLLSVAACDSNDAPIDDEPADGALKACLERPGELPRPPRGQLPCELVPPGLSL